MPRKKSANTEKLPKDTPKRTPKRTPKAAPESTPKQAPKVVPIKRPNRTPRPAPIAAPIVAPESYAISFYSLPNWEADHSTSPHSYGNRGMALYQAHTEADGKVWLREHEYYGHFAAVERINGKIGKSWHVEIEPLEEETGADPDEGYELIDPDLDLEDSELLNPAIVRAKIENAKLRAQLEARNGHGGLGELLEGVKFVEEIKKQAAPQKSLVEQIREAKELVETITPRREVTAPAPAPQVDPKIEALKLIAESPNTAEIVKEIFFGSKSESDPWAEVAMEAVKSGQLAPIVQAAISGLGNLFANLLPKPAQAPAPVQTPQAAAPQQTPQAAPQAAQTSQPALPAQQPAMEAVNADPYTAMLTNTITALANNDPIDQAVRRVDGFLALMPQYRPVVDELFDQEANTLLSAIGGIPGCESIPSLPHAKTWVENFQRAFFDEGEETSEFTEKEIES